MLQFNQRLEQEQWSAMRHFSFSSLIFFCTVIWIKFPGALTCPLDPKGTSSNVLLRDDSLLAFEGKKIYDVFCCCSSTNKCFNGCSFLTFLFNKHLFNNEGQMAPEKQTLWGCLRPPPTPSADARLMYERMKMWLRLLWGKCFISQRVFPHMYSAYLQVLLLIMQSAQSVRMPD